MTNPEDTSRDNRPDTMPLKWAAGYRIDPAGVVLRADGSALKAVSLSQARRYARQDIQHDPPRHSAAGVSHGRAGSSALVLLMDDGTRVVEFLTLWSDSERARLDGGGDCSRLLGFTMPAAGDTECGWYWMRTDDGRRCLFHGPSYAKHLLDARP